MGDSGRRVVEEELELLRACDALSRVTDELLERATRERRPLARTVTGSLPLLAA